ncbi:hypothetical protein AFV8_gp52 [Betalipothrixvirus puteoliense]|uniref:Uncharacterized protein n=1 Tax=Betalipothrixvirus puteoliense TaxID=346884 RepID=A7WKY1_9VIRU|nr:hypothetical protein AFV8_gp52 [Acidianus filamentous virus 8]CAJ31729.1 conserved hypothetical protein [Acidianus filamentous virus 8]
MKLKQPVTITGIATIRIKHLDTGKVEEYVTTNIMTNAGLNEIASHWVLPWTMPSNYGYVMEVGSGTGTPSNTDTGMFSPIYPCFEYVSPSVSGNQITFVASYLPSQCNGYTFQEAGIAFPAQLQESNGQITGVSGTLVDHLVFPIAVQKTSSIYLEIIITFVIV